MRDPRGIVMQPVFAATHVGSMEELMNSSRAAIDLKALRPLTVVESIAFVLPSWTAAVGAGGRDIRLCKAPMVVLRMIGGIPLALKCFCDLIRVNGSFVTHKSAEELWDAVVAEYGNSGRVPTRLERHQMQTFFFALLGLSEESTLVLRVPGVTPEQLEDMKGRGLIRQHVTTPSKKSKRMLKERHWWHYTHTDRREPGVLCTAAETERRIEG